MGCPIINGECSLYTLMKRELDKVERLRQDEHYQKISNLIYKQEFAAARTHLKEISCDILRQKLEEKLDQAIEDRMEYTNHIKALCAAEDLAKNGNLDAAIAFLEKNVRYPEDDIERLKLNYPPKPPKLTERLLKLWKTKQ